MYVVPPLDSMLSALGSFISFIFFDVRIFKNSYAISLS